MPTCRYCRGVYPQDQFIRGNGPRYLHVCVRCAVEQGFVTPDEVPQLYSDEIARARTSLSPAVMESGLPSSSLGLLGYQLVKVLLSGHQQFLLL